MPLSLKNYKTIISTLVIISYLCSTLNTPKLAIYYPSGQGHLTKGKQDPVWVVSLRRERKNDYFTSYQGDRGILTKGMFYCHCQVSNLMLLLPKLTTASN